MFTKTWPACAPVPVQGTTTIQTAIVQNSYELSVDEVIAPTWADLPGPWGGPAYCGGCKAVANLAHYLEWNSSPEAPQFRAYSSFLRRAEEARANLLLSAEGFDRPTIPIELLARAMQPFNTTVVITYRRYHQWVVSVRSTYHPRGNSQPCFTLVLLHLSPTTSCPPLLVL